MPHEIYPNLRPVADTGVLVEFGHEIDDDVHQRVLSFDACVQQTNIIGLVECVPTYTCLLVNYNPLLTDYDLVCEQLQPHLSTELNGEFKPTHWQVPACYAESKAPDLHEIADILTLSPQDIVEQHCAGRYKIYMFGFAPGYAYMGGVPEKIQTPRKQAPVMNVPPQTVMIAGSQCLISTLTMPTGWWRIGMTNFQPLQMSRSHPFVFNVGDSVEFIPMSETEFLQQTDRD